MGSNKVPDFDLNSLIGAGAMGNGETVQDPPSEGNSNPEMASSLHEASESHEDGGDTSVADAGFALNPVILTLPEEDVEKPEKTPTIDAWLPKKDKKLDKQRKLGVSDKSSELKKMLQSLFLLKEATSGRAPEMDPDEKIDAIIALWEPYIEMEPVPLQVPVPWWSGAIFAAMGTIAIMWGDSISGLMQSVHTNAVAQHPEGSYVPDQ